MLIVLSGLPGTGKTTISQLLVRKCGATYLRIDTIEQTIPPSLRTQNELSTLGYVLAYEIARANLRLGGTVVVDGVNPLSAIREAWRAVAEDSNSIIMEVEVVCTKIREHRLRVESRKADIPGHILPNWDDVQRYEYEPWSGHRVVIDSSKLSAVDAASQIVDYLELRR
jgi:predicted kinase